MVDTAAAVLAGHAVRRQPDLRRLREQAGREVVARVPLLRDRAQLALGEVVRERLQLTLLVGERERDAAPGVRAQTVILVAEYVPSTWISTLSAVSLTCETKVPLSVSALGS